jgi:type 1 glutamine amidotransferase
MTTRRFNRRDVLKTSALGAAALGFSPFLSRILRGADAAAGAAAVGSAAQPKKILYFTKSAGFQHSVITRNPKDPEKLAYSEQILTDLGAKNGFEVTCSKDGRIFKSGDFQKFDGIVFYTTGDLTKDSDKYVMKKGPDGKNSVQGELIHHEAGMGDDGKAAFLQAIKDGKGFMALHSGSDTFHSKGHVKGDMNLIRDVNETGQDSFDPYIQMLGGEFIVHGAQQPSTLKCVDGAFPGAKAFDGASFAEEWYSLKNFAPDLHVILVQETTGMKGPMYQRGAFPETWARMDGKGRVFYTSMGHREDVWQKPEYLGLLVGAMSWITGRVNAEVPANIKEVTPAADPKPFPKEEKK